MKELWPLEENKYIFLFYGETVPSWCSQTIDIQTAKTGEYLKIGLI